MFNFAIQRDCPGGVCEPDSSGEVISAVFDADGDGVVTLLEIKENTLIQSLISPDVDLLGDDGIKESVSIGVGIHCRKQNFDAGELE